MVVCVVRAGSSVAHTAPRLVSALMHVPKPVVCAPSILSRVQAYPLGRDRKTPCHNTTLGKPCSNTKSYVATGMSHPWENSVATQGDPCRNLSLALPQTLSRHRADKSLARQRRSLLQPKPPSMFRNNVATRRSLSRHKSRKLCPGSCAWPENHVATRKTTSRHKANILYRDRDPKMGSSPFWSSTPPVPLYFLSKTP